MKRLKFVLQDRETFTACLTLFFLFLNSTTLQAATRGLELHEPAETVLTPVVKGKYRALIIGNSGYRDKGESWAELKTARADAVAVSNILRDQYGFIDVTVLEDATRRETLLELRELGERVGRNDSVLIYYAGHGFLDEETNKGYWIPVDATGMDHTTFLRNSTIRDELSIISARSRHTLLISDSCFSGTLLRRGNRGAAPKQNVDRYYDKVARKKSVQILTAGGVEFVDDDYRGSGHSPFTYFLLKELQHNDKALLTLSELATNVQKAVANNVEQVPESGVLQGVGDELGEFVFLNVKITIGVRGVARENVSVDIDVVPQPEQSEQQAEPQSIDAQRQLLLPLPAL